jgi:hypothetical protein
MKEHPQTTENKRQKALSRFNCRGLYQLSVNSYDFAEANVMI